MMRELYEGQDAPSPEDSVWARGTRTRGVVRTRGAVPRPSPTPQLVQGSVTPRKFKPTLGYVATPGGGGGQTPVGAAPQVVLSVAKVVETAREDLDRFPLTVVVHLGGEGELAVELFKREVAPLLQRDDAVWFIAADPGFPQLDDDALVLYLSDERDRVHAGTLVADVLCVAATDAAKLAEVLAGWECRTLALVVACPDAGGVAERLGGLRYLFEADSNSSHRVA